MADMQRVNIRVSPQVYEWFKARSEQTGVAMSSLMFLALEQHIQQMTLIPFVPEIMERSREHDKQKMDLLESDKPVR